MLKVVIAVVVLLLAGVGLFAYFSQPTKERVPTDLDAAQTCRQMVSDRLAVPAAFATFSEGADRQVTRNADGTFTVHGYVDVHTDSGSTRTTYTCQVEYTGGERWRLVALDGL